MSQSRAWRIALNLSAAVFISCMFACLAFIWQFAKSGRGVELPSMLSFLDGVPFVISLMYVMSQHPRVLEALSTFYDNNRIIIVSFFINT